jgi:hypothetical protein
MAKPFGDQGFCDAWGRAWSCGDVDALLPFYPPRPATRDVGNNLAVTGHELRRFYRWMLAFAPDSKVVSAAAHGDEGTIASHEDYYDLRSVLMQLKLLPAPA